jgi:hypothetical protein
LKKQVCGHEKILNFFKKGYAEQKKGEKQFAWIKQIFIPHTPNKKTKCMAQQQHLVFMCGCP